jgi:hypothetical protein
MKKHPVIKRKARGVSFTSFSLLDAMQKNPCEIKRIIIGHFRVLESYGAKVIDAQSHVRVAVDFEYGRLGAVRFVVDYAGNEPVLRDA